MSFGGRGSMDPLMSEDDSHQFSFHSDVATAPTSPQKRMRISPPAHGVHPPLDWSMAIPGTGHVPSAGVDFSAPPPPALAQLPRSSSRESLASMLSIPGPPLHPYAASYATTTSGTSPMPQQQFSGHRRNLSGGSGSHTQHHSHSLSHATVNSFLAPSMASTAPRRAPMSPQSHYSVSPQPINFSTTAALSRSSSPAPPPRQNGWAVAAGGSPYGLEHGLHAGGHQPRGATPEPPIFWGDDKHLLQPPPGHVGSHRHASSLVLPSGAAPTIGRLHGGAGDRSRSPSLHRSASPLSMAQHVPLGSHNLAMALSPSYSEHGRGFGAGSSGGLISPHHVHLHNHQQHQQYLQQQGSRIRSKSNDMFANDDDDNSDAASVPSGGASAGEQSMSSHPSGKGLQRRNTIMGGGGKDSYMNPPAVAVTATIIPASIRAMSSPATQRKTIGARIAASAAAVPSPASAARRAPSQQQRQQRRQSSRVVSAPVRSDSDDDDDDDEVDSDRGDEGYRPRGGNNNHSQQQLYKGQPVRMATMATATPYYAAMPAFPAGSGNAVMAQPVMATARGGPIVMAQPVIARATSIPPPARGGGGNSSVRPVMAVQVPCPPGVEAPLQATPLSSPPPGMNGAASFPLQGTKPAASTATTVPASSGNRKGAAGSMDVESPAATNRSLNGRGGRTARSSRSTTSSGPNARGGTRAAAAAANKISPAQASPVVGPATALPLRQGSPPAMAHMAMPVPVVALAVAGPGNNVFRDSPTALYHAHAAARGSPSASPPLVGTNGSNSPSVIPAIAARSPLKRPLDAAYARGAVSKLAMLSPALGPHSMPAMPVSALQLQSSDGSNQKPVQAIIARAHTPPLHGRRGTNNNNPLDTGSWSPVLAVAVASPPNSNVKSPPSHVSPIVAWQQQGMKHNLSSAQLHAAQQAFLQPRFHASNSMALEALQVANFVPNSELGLSTASTSISSADSSATASTALRSFTPSPVPSHAVSKAANNYALLAHQQQQAAAHFLRQDLRGGSSTHGSSAGGDDDASSTSGPITGYQTPRNPAAALAASDDHHDPPTPLLLSRQVSNGPMPETPRTQALSHQLSSTGLQSPLLGWQHADGGRAGRPGALAVALEYPGGSAPFALHTPPAPAIPAGPAHTLALSRAGNADLPPSSNTMHPSSGAAHSMFSNPSGTKRSMRSVSPPHPSMALLSPNQQTLHMFSGNSSSMQRRGSGQSQHSPLFMPRSLGDANSNIGMDMLEMDL